MRQLLRRLRLWCYLIGIRSSWWAPNGRGGGAYTHQRPAAKRELQFLVKREVGNEEIVCGYAGFSPPKGYPGPMPAPDLFILRNGRLFTAKDMTADQFGRWEDRLCGPEWVKPLTTPEPPSSR